MRWNDAPYESWGRIAPAPGPRARPERQSALAATLAEAPAPAIGNRRSYGDACLNSEGPAIDMTRLDRILDLDREAGEIEAEAGLTIGEIARITAARGWLPRVMPGTGFATLGGCIANDVHGKNHHTEGSFAQHVSALTLMTPQGPRRLSASQEPELFAATLGGLGQTGPILSARLRLKPTPGEAMRVRERRAESWDEFIAMLDASQATYAVGWIDALARGPALGRGVLEEAELSGAPVGAPGRARSVPFTAPGLVMSSPVVRAFNALYYRRIPLNGRTVTRRLDDFFFPLDRLHNVNRLYGKTGFYQFQNVVPLSQAEALREMLARIAASGLASPLAVLKRMGPGRAGALSFPAEGYTLAVDFPNRGAAEALVGELIAQTRAAGGRIYLAKDALARPEDVWPMYPERAAWARVVNAHDPAHAYETDLTRRLRLRDEG